MTDPRDRTEAAADSSGLLCDARAGGPEGARRLAAVVAKCWDAISVHAVDGTVKFANAAVGELVRCPSDELTGAHPSAYVHPEDGPMVAEAFRAALDGAACGDAVQYRIRRLNGEVRTVESLVSNLLDDPDVAGLLVTTRDVTARLLADERLQRLALHDSVTGLPNRTSFSVHLVQAIATMTAALAVVHVEVDRFDWLVDARGHAFGDDVLRALGARLRASVDGFVARLGTGAFTVVLELASCECVLDRAKKLLAELQRPLRIGGQIVEATASIGVAFVDPGGDAGAVTRCAASAAHVARERGGARVEL